MDQAGVPARGPMTMGRATLVPLVGITYCMVAGGPYGLEEVVGSAGYGRAVLLLVVTPLLWAFPVTLMVSELSTALPEDGGYYVWVRRAMGPFWGFQEAWLSLAASVFDMALYPTLFVTYLARVWPPAAGNGWVPTAVGVGLIAVCVGINLAGIRLVGAGSLVMTVALLLPFAAVVALALCQHPRPATIVDPAASAGAEPVGWVGGLLVVMWNYMGWDNTSTIAGEVDRPQRTYPLAMLAAVLLVAATYIAPVAAVARTGIASAGWDTGAWVDVGRTVGQRVAPRVGTALALAITAGGMISAFSMFNALILSYSRVPVALAADGFLPRIMARRARRTGVPWVAILVCADAWAACLRLGFDKLLLLDALLYGLSLVLEFAALVALRLREPDLPRPFRVPGGIPGCVALGVLPTIIIAVAGYHASLEDGARRGMIVLAITTASGVALYGPVAWLNRRRHPPVTRTGQPSPDDQPVEPRS